MIKHFVNTKYDSISIDRAVVRETKKMYIVESYQPVYGYNFVYSNAHIRKSNANAFDTIEEAIAHVLKTLENRKERHERKVAEVCSEIGFFKSLDHTEDPESYLKETRRIEVVSSYFKIEGRNIK